MGPCLEFAERRAAVVRTKQDEYRDWLDCSGRVFLGGRFSFCVEFGRA